MLPDLKYTAKMCWLDVKYNQNKQTIGYRLGQMGKADNYGPRGPGFISR